MPRTRRQRRTPINAADHFTNRGIVADQLRRYLFSGQYLLDSIIILCHITERTCHVDPV